MVERRERNMCMSDSSIWGGFAPAMATLLVDKYNSSTPGFIMTGLAVVVWLGLWIAPKQEMEAIEEDQSGGTPVEPSSALPGHAHARTRTQLHTSPVMSQYRCKPKVLGPLHRFRGICDVSAAAACSHRVAAGAVAVALPPWLRPWLASL